MVPSVAPIPWQNCWFLQWLCTLHFSVDSFLVGGMFFLSLQLHCLLECVMLWMDLVFLLWLFMIWDILFVQLRLTFILFLLKILGYDWGSACLLDLGTPYWYYTFFIRQVEPSYISVSKNHLPPVNLLQHIDIILAIFSWALEIDLYTHTIIYNNPPPITFTSQTFKSYIHFLNYAMMIIYSLVKIITIHTHTDKNNDIGNTNNYCNILTLYSLYFLGTYNHGLQWCIINISLTHHN